MNDWDDLRYILEVARTGSVSGAAQRLGVNHSTVSRRINAYENKHDVRLFERLPQGYEMTQAAENIYQYALEIEERTLLVERSLFGRDTRLQGRLCVTAFYEMANLLMPHFGEFRQAYPEIDLELFVTKEIRDLAAREADVAIRGTPNPPETLVGKKIADSVSGIYTSEAYESCRTQRHAVVLWRDETAPPAWVTTHFPDAAVALRVDDVVTMREAVKQGLGIARMPCWIADRDPRLLRMALDATENPWGIWVLVHADLRSTARVRVMRDFLIEKLALYQGLIEGRQSTYLP